MRFEWYAAARRRDALAGRGTVPGNMLTEYFNMKRLRGFTEIPSSSLGNEQEMRGSDSLLRFLTI